jgi:Ca2+-binding RTX toxin-like protein
MPKIEKVHFEDATDAGEYIVGTNGDDTIDALGGDDKVKARDGDDYIRGGEGNDRLYGQDGDDKLVGDTGNDTISGGDGDDKNTWNNGDGSDVFDGGEGYDTQIVNGSDTAGDDFTIGADGDRVAFARVNFGQFSVDIGETEVLKVYGLGGDDTITGSEGLSELIKLKLSGGEGNDQITGGDGDDRIYGDEGDDRTVGFRGDDKIYGDDGDDTNTWNNGDGTDKFYGGEGFDTQIVNGSPDLGDEFTIAADGQKVQFDRVNFGQFGVTMSEVEELVVNGLGGDDTMTGSEGLRDLISLELNGGDGNDAVAGGDGDDVLTGGTGDDELAGEKGNDTVLGGDGDDELEWDDGDGSDLMEGDAGWDTVEVEGSLTEGDHFVIEADGARVAFARVNLGQFALDIGTSEVLEVDGAGGDDLIEAGEGLAGLIALELSGGTGNDTITGGDGDDLIDGGWDDDVMTGGWGEDTFVFNKGDDVITDFEDGVDVIQLSKYDAWSEVAPSIEQYGQDVVIDTAHGSLTIEHASVEQFDASDFLFV